PGNAQILRALGLFWAKQGINLDAGRALSAAHEKLPKDNEVAITLARVMLDLGFLGDARVVLLSILDSSPNEGEALLLLAEVSVNPTLMEECDQRIERFNAADKTPAILASALLDLRRGEIEEGVSKVDQVLEMNPEFSKALALKGAILRVRQEPESALQPLEKAAAIAGPRSQENLSYVTALMALERTDDAVGVLEKATKAAPEYLPNWRMLAMIAASQGKDAEAEAHLKKVLSKNASDIEAVLLRSELFLRAKEPQKAVESLEKLTQVFPNRPVIVFPLAKAYLAAGDSLKASSTLDQLLALMPNATEAVLMRTRLFLQEGKAAEAIRSLEPVVAANPADMSAKELLAGAYAAADRKTDALAVLKEQSEASSKDPAPLVNMGKIFLSENQVPQARDSFEKALVISPGNVEALSQLTTIDLQSGQADNAMARVDRFLSSNEGSAEAWLLKAGIDYSRKAFDAAEGSLEKSISLKSANPKAYGMLART
ncbi:MAG: tetratricopeptide repeat protein, partial [Alphaproteobacteria bacterium]